MNDHYFLLWRGRTNIDSNSDMELCGSRNGCRQQENKQGNFQKCFHGFFRDLLLNCWSVLIIDTKQFAEFNRHMVSIFSQICWY